MKTKKTGFTIMEITIVIIILGVLAALALPRMSNSFERARVGEGIQILDALLTAQRAFEFENPGDFAAATCDANGCGALDVTFTNPANFDFPQTFNPADPVANPLATIARIEGADILYTLSINSEGTITCDDGSITCATIGY